MTYGFWAIVGVIAAFGLVGAACGSTRGRGIAGFFLGFFVGPIGWVVVLLLPQRRVYGRRRRTRRMR